MRFRLVLTAALTLAAAFVAAPPVYASCATEARVSPYTFVGTVISTEKKDHSASVITDNGQRVTVLGTEGGFPESFRSTDRRYALGGRYEFHPLNGESPYQDNTCTTSRCIKFL